MRTKHLLILLVFVFVLAGLTLEVLSQDPDSEKGDMILKAMSRKLAESQSFSFSTSEFHDRLKQNGQRVQINVTRDVMIRRPNGFWSKYYGDRDFEFWYDGKQLTVISPQKKIYVQRDMPPTIDESLDMLAQRLNLDLPMSDVIYSNPYDAFMDDQTRGGLVGKENINGESCGHLTYVTPAVDWQLWINETTSLPCKLELKYKNQKGISNYKITFSKWNLKREIKSDVFASKIPQGYVRIPILERVVVQPDNPQQTPSNNP